MTLLLNQLSLNGEKVASSLLKSAFVSKLFPSGGELERSSRAFRGGAGLDHRNKKISQCIFDDQYFKLQVISDYKQSSVILIIFLMEVADAGWDGNTDIRWGKKLNNLIDGHRDMDEDLFGWPPLFFGTNVYFFRLEELTENDVSLKTNISRNIVL